MCTAVLTAVSAVGSIMQGYSQQQAAKAQAAASEQNARIAENSATDSVKRGGQEELRMRRRMSGLRGAQNAAAAAAGITLDSGSLADVQMSSATEAERDISINAENAQREAWGYRVEAVNHRNAASAARAAGRNAFTSGIIGAGTTLLSLATPTVDSIGSGGIKVAPAAQTGAVALGPGRAEFDALNVASYTPAMNGQIPYWRK